MPSEVIRCTDCGAVFKGIPAWLTTAQVKFSCTNCPKRPSRGVARFEPLGSPVSAADADDDAEMEDVVLDDLEEDAEMEDVVLDDLDDSKE